MSIQFPNPIDARYPSGQPPCLTEIAEQTVRLNKTSKASFRRYHDVRQRAHVFAAGAIRDCPEAEVQARDLYLFDEYQTFSHREKCLNGMILASLCQLGLIPFEPLPYRWSPKRYRIVAEQSDFELARSLTDLSA